MQPVTTTSRTLEFAPPCKQLSLIMLVMYPLGLSLTWYRVWWDSIIGFVAAAFGYYVLRDPDGQQLHHGHVSNFYYANIASMISHVIAVCVVLYYMLQGHLLNDVIGLHDVHVDEPGWVFFGFLLALLAVEITATAFAIWRAGSLIAEIARNSVLTDLTPGSARA